MDFSERHLPHLEQAVEGQPSRRYRIPKGGIRLGRAQGVDIRFEDDRVSRWHARIELYDDGTCYLLDTSSHRRTYLNDERLENNHPQRLRDGDQIRIASHELIFHGASPVLRGREDAGSTVLHTLRDLGPEPLAKGITKPARALQTMLEISRVLGGGTIDEFLDRALGCLMRAFPRANYGLIVTEEPNGRLPIRAARSEGSTPPPSTFSRAILDRVLRHGEAVLIRDVATDARFRDNESAQTLLRSAICVPLSAHDGKPLGMVQLAGRGGKGQSFEQEELELLALLVYPLGVAIENQRLVNDAAARSSAREIQRALLPRGRPEVPGYTFWDCYHPAYEVGGDLYDYVRVGGIEGGLGGEWVVCVGDVAGKGLPASLLSAAVGPELRHTIRGGASAVEVLGRLNRVVYEGDYDSRFVTLLLAVLEPVAHRVTFVSAGHERALIRRTSGAVDVLEPSGRGTPLGVAPDPEYHPTTVQLEPGDVVVLYTDGLPDSQNREGKRLGLDAVVNALSQAGPDAAGAGQALVDLVGEHARGRTPFDDLTLVCLGRVAAAPTPSA